MTHPSRRTLHGTCETHPGGRGFCNLRFTKQEGRIVIDPHVDGACKISLNEEEATEVRDLLSEWLGDP